MADPVSKSQLEMASQLENFAITLFQGIGKRFPGNICISPFSVAALLSMVHAGARGETAKQLKEALGFGKFSEQEINDIIGNMIKCTKGDENFLLKAANLCYVKDQFEMKEKFQSILETNFGAQAENVNFGDPETRTKINSDVEEFTNKKIQDLLSVGAIGPMTVMVLVNAVYFKGDWLKQFDPELTQIKPFSLGLESKVDVKMMRLTGKIFRTGKIDSLDARFLELPYEGQKLSMVIILPNKIDGIKKVESNISCKVLEEMEENSSMKKIHVEFPKFQIGTTVGDQLMDALIEMGIEDLFSGVADLSGVSVSPGLSASSIVQKCFIEVDEKGTEAAAATALTTLAKCAPPQLPSFKVDRPAMFLLKDDVTKLILFIGRLANPAQK